LEELRLDWIYQLASFETMSVGYDGLDELRSGAIGLVRLSESSMVIWYNWIGLDLG
jgi:hypothetical protein